MAANTHNVQEQTVFLQGWPSSSQMATMESVIVTLCWQPTFKMVSITYAMKSWANRYLLRIYRYVPHIVCFC